MIALQRVAASILAVVALSAAGADIARSTPFAQLGARTALPLRGDGAIATLDFGSRSDELVTRALFRFRYLGSPALAPAASHIRLALNGDVIGTLSFSDATSGALAVRSIEVDPRLLVGFNKLTMTFVAAAGDAAA
ncbi:MAG: cellulose biosynthesis cyclic di-GMP-binding regulatory protein BcsB, partial [Burkholderiales bacterium]|nr:cellulose biosynthesis cyclic di-GMP-binding regulatory protein BcsB [Burkholderiales bacterium]